MARKPAPAAQAIIDELDDGLPPVPLTNSPLFALTSPPPVAAPSPIDLTGKPKVVLAVAPGNNGKTTLCRIVSERAVDREGAALATVDPLNRELVRFYEETEQPVGADGNPTRDRDEIDAWLDRYITSLIANPGNAIIDFGGGDTALTGLLRRMDLEKRLADAGISIVLLYPLAGRQDDLTPMSDLGDMDFFPACTAIVLNHIIYKKGESHQSLFRLTQRHPSYKRAIDQGAVPIWLPHLASASLVRDRHITFADAIAGRMPEGKPGRPLGISQSADVEKWWRATSDALAPIDRWLP